MSVNPTPAAPVPAVGASSTPANPGAENGPNAPAIPLAMTVPVLPSNDNSSVAAAPPITVVPPVDTINAILPTDTAAPKRKTSQKPGYLDYDEQKLQETLNGMEDAMIWAEKHQEVYKTMVKWHRSFTKRGLELPHLLSEVIPCFVELEDDPAACHEQLVDFLTEQRATQPSGLVNTTAPTPMVQPAPTPSDVAPNPVPGPSGIVHLGHVTQIPKEPILGGVTTTAPPPAVHNGPMHSEVAPSSILPTSPTAPGGNVPPMANQPPAVSGPQPPAATTGPAPVHIPTPQPEAGPSRQRQSPGPRIGNPGHRRRVQAVPMMSTHIARPRQQPARGASDIKGKQRYREPSSGSEYEEDELESEDDSEAPVIKQEPLAEQPGFQAYAREVQIEMELEAEAERVKPKTGASAAKGPRRKVKQEPKTPAIVPDTDDEEEDTPRVVDRYAAAGENDPPCNNCASRNVTCQFVVDEWLTQCKLCQRQKVGCSVSAAKVLALKNSGRKRPRPAKGTTTRAPVKREAKPPKVPRQTPAPRKSRNKRAGLGISSRRGETAAPGEYRDEHMDPLEDLIERFDRFERRQKDMEKGMRQLSRDVREVKSAQISLAVGTNQQSLRIMEHHSLMIAEISRLLRAAGISTQINVPSSMYLGNTPNKSAMSLEDLAAQWPRLFDNSPNIRGDPEESPSEGSRTPAVTNDPGRVEGVINADPSGVGSKGEQNNEMTEGSGLIIENHVPATNIPCEDQSAPRPSTPPFPSNSGGIGSEQTTTPTVAPAATYTGPDPMTSSLPTPHPPPPTEPLQNVGPSHGSVTNMLPVVLHMPPPLSPIIEQQETDADADRMNVDSPPAGSHPPSIIGTVPDIPLAVVHQPTPTQPTTAAPTVNSAPTAPSLPPLSSEHNESQQTGVPSPPGIQVSPVTQLGTGQVPPPTDMMTAQNPAPIIETQPGGDPADHIAPPPMSQTDNLPEAVATLPPQGQPAGLIVPPGTSVWGTKRGRSSSVVSTRSSKRLRGETPV